MSTIDIKDLLRRLVLVLPAAIVIGSAVALFLWLLDGVIGLKFGHPWLLYLLPLAGIVIHLVYRWAGSSSEKGNSLIIEEIRQPGGGVPRRMAPVILLTTLITHLFGGSVGREGTAVQMGGSIAGAFGKRMKLSGADRSTLLIAGMSAGFGAVFGTPFAGAVFALEVLTAKRANLKSFIPALAASLVADGVVAIWGIRHTVYKIGPAVQHIDTAWQAASLALKVIFASALFGLAALFFIEAVHRLKEGLRSFIRAEWLIPVIGGAAVIALTLALQKPDYLGLGVAPPYPGAITIPSAFHTGGADTWSWLWKTIYTAVTVGSGFKGGEVTPLFYIGATFGNTLSVLMDAPAGLFAALGFIAVFAGATNTPVACAIMGVELFGVQYTPLFIVACFIAYLFSGHAGIYHRAETLKGFRLAAYLGAKVRKYLS